MISPEELKRLRELEKAATPGPWSISKSKWCDAQWGTRDGEGSVTEECLPCVALIWEDGTHGDRDLTLLARREELVGKQLTSDEAWANGDLISGLRNAAPALLDELERLLADNEKLRKELDAAVGELIREEDEP